jgi:hypothetical protein
MRHAAAVVVAAALSATLAGACGLRTPVRPPEDTAPVVPGAVTVTRTEEEAVVRWPRAERSVDGERLDDLAAFVVERRASDSEPWSQVATVSVVDQEKIRRRNSFSWHDPAPAPGVSYRVFAVTADGQAGPPTAPAVTPPPSPPSPSPPSP